jgi:hypothetical protein
LTITEGVISMGKAKAHKIQKTKLTEEDKKLGKSHIYILISMIVIGLALALYNMQ